MGCSLREFFGLSLVCRSLLSVLILVSNFVGSCLLGVVMVRFMSLFFVRKMLVYGLFGSFLFVCVSRDGVRLKGFVCRKVCSLVFGFEVCWCSIVVFLVRVVGFLMR